MDIPAATLTQVRTGRDGRRVLIEDDVQDIARRLKEISPKLSLQWNDKGEFFMVIETLEDGEERLVTTTLELDGRLIARMEQVASPDHDYVAEIDRLDREAEKAKDHAFSEQVGEIAERLASAVRKDLGASKIIVPKDL